MAARPILSILSIVFLAGGILFELFVILSGVHSVKVTPFDQTYFLQADTSGVTSGGTRVPNPARWTFFSICGSNSGHNANCLPVSAAVPFDPKRNFHTTNAGVSNLPASIVNHANMYYYLSRVAWAFYIIAIFFAVVALFLSFTAICSRLAAKLTGLMTLIAVVMQIICASLMTAWTVEARQAFRKNGQNAKLGTYAYAWTWSALACWIISSVLFCIGGGSGKNDNYQKSSYFGRKRSTRSSRSRGSFRDSESHSRVKDEYE